MVLFSLAEETLGLLSGLNTHYYIVYLFNRKIAEQLEEDLQRPDERKRRSGSVEMGSPHAGRHVITESFRRRLGSDAAGPSFEGRSREGGGE